MSTYRIFLCSFVLAIIIPATTMAERSVVFHVALNGNDAWSGTMGRPRRGETDGPFATVAGAQRAIRDLKAKPGEPSGPIEVIIHDGIHFLSEPVVFTAEDSGTAEAPVIYRADRPGRAIISGGIPLEGWRKAVQSGKAAWEVKVPPAEEGEPAIRQLFVNDRRCSRTRLPTEGFYHFTGLPEVTKETRWNEGQTIATFAADDLERWKNLNDVEIVALHLWSDSRLPIASIQEASQIVTFAKKSQFRLTDDTMAAGATAGARYYVENVAEALDSPGEWYLDRPSRILTYIPFPDEVLELSKMAAARLPELVRFEPGARHIHLRDLTFSHTEWSFPEDRAGSPQAEVFVPGAIVLDGAESCRIEDCEVSHLAGYAIELVNQCRHNEIVGCHLFDLGAGGIKLGHDTASTTVSHTTIEDGGILYHAAVGVWIGNSGDNTVIHNHIARLNYTGISVGWSWGYEKSNAVRNKIEYNHIHDIGRGLLSDMGGIYTLGVSPGTVLRYNLIHDVNCYRYGGWGIYPDEGSTHIIIENNLVYRTNSAGFHQHYGKENIVRNNIFAFGDQAQVMRTRAEKHAMFSFERNIVVSANGKMIQGKDWNLENALFESNLYYDVNNSELDFSGMSFSEWQEKGFDLRSVIADPVFANLEKDDFRLRSNSPAFDLGFEKFDLSRVGPRKRRSPR
jgi:hypothetical protein